MTNSKTNIKFNPLPGKLQLIIDEELYTSEVINIWNDYVDEQGREDEYIWLFCEDNLDELLKDWPPSDIVFSLQCSDERDNWFIINHSSSEIISFPEWEVENHVNMPELIDWLVKDDKWQEYPELASAADIEL